MSELARKDPLLQLLGRHQLASFAATGIDYLTMIVVVSALGRGPVLGTVIGALCGAIANFTLGRHFTFRATARRPEGQALRYVLVSGGSLLLNAAGEHLLAVELGIQYVLARMVVGLLVSVAWNFPLQRYFVFRHVLTDMQPKNQNRELVTAIPGPRSAALRAREDAHLAPGTQGYAIMAGIAVDRAAGSTVTDVDGNTFIDLIGGIGVGALGHSHPTLVTALQAQVARASVGSFTSEARVELLERLAAHAPAPKLHRLQLYSGGAEAVESALRLAKSATGKYEFLSFWGGFHGKTLGVLSLMGSTFKDKLGPMAPGAHLAPYADCYRCPLGQTYPSCGVACAELARKQVKIAGAGALAAVIVEPIQGTAGNVVPPKEFLPAIASIARDAGALFIADEMITGLGRTGTWWGVEHSGVIPDVVTIGKAFGGGFPLSGLLTTDELASAKPWSNPSGSSSSYGGNPLGAAAGAAALRIIEEEKLVENARHVGEVMLGVLQGFVEKYPFVGHARGAGLLLGLELVRDKKTKEPLPRRVTERIFHECVTRGLLTMSYAPSFRLQPALTIDEATAQNGLAILAEVFDWVAREGIWQA